MCYEITFWVNNKKKPTKEGNEKRIILKTWYIAFYVIHEIIIDAAFEPFIIRGAVLVSFFFVMGKVLVSGSSIWFCLC